MTTNMRAIRVAMGLTFIWFASCHSDKPMNKNIKNATARSVSGLQITMGPVSVSDDWLEGLFALEVLKRPDGLWFHDNYTPVICKWWDDARNCVGQEPVYVFIPIEFGLHKID